MPAKAKQLDIHPTIRIEREEPKSRLRVGHVVRAAPAPATDHRKLALRRGPALTRCVVHVAKRALEVEGFPRSLAGSDATNFALSDAQRPG